MEGGSSTLPPFESLSASPVASLSDFFVASSGKLTWQYYYYQDSSLTHQQPSSNTVPLTKVLHSLWARIERRASYVAGERREERAGYLVDQVVYPVGETQGSSKR
jgi:hypothetical protein